MKTTETTGTGERQPTHDFQIFQKRLLPIPSREKMPNNRHAYQDYNGPRTKGFTPPQLDQEEEENPLDALWVEEEGGLSLAPPCGSPVSFIHAMLDFVCLSKEDILYDLGCGDGRVLLEASVRTKCQQCMGIEIESDLVERAQQLIDGLPTKYRIQNTVDGPERVQVIHGDLREVLSEFVHRQNGSSSSREENEGDGTRPYEHLPMPNVITLYLLPEGIASIEEDLTKLLPKTKIVCVSWGLKRLQPIEQKVYYARNGAQTTMYLYTNECFERLKGFEYMLTVYNS